MDTLGSRIGRMRRAKGFTQEELAEKLGVSAQAVSKWENDISCPDIQLLPQLAKLLGTTVDQLLTGQTQEVTLLPESQRKPLDELTFRIRILSAAGDKLRVNLPMPLVKMGLELGIDIGTQMPNFEGMEALKQIDIAKIIDMVERGMIGKIVEIESAAGDALEIVVE